MVIQIATLRQQNNQSVPELIADLNELENQMDPPYDDLARRDHLFLSLHEHIWRSIIIQGRPWSTRAELEQVARSLEFVLTPPEGIQVKAEGYPAPCCAWRP